MTPTGRTRFRTSRSWGREFLVLQIEERYLATYYAGGVIDSEYTTRWRDAKVEDLPVDKTIASAA